MLPEEVYLLDYLCVGFAILPVYVHAAVCTATGVPWTLGGEALVCNYLVDLHRYRAQGMSTKKAMNAALPLWVIFTWPLFVFSIVRWWFLGLNSLLLGSKNEAGLKILAEKEKEIAKK